MSDSPEKVESAVPDSASTPILAQAVHAAGQDIKAGLIEIGLAQNTLGDFYKVPLFELAWRPFVAPLDSVFTFTVRGNTPLELSQQFADLRDKFGPMLKEFYADYKKLVPANGNGQGKPEQPAPPKNSPPEQTEETGRRRRRGKKGGSESSSGSEGSFDVVKITVFKSKAQKLCMKVEGHTKDDQIVDALPAGPAAWAKYFPQDEQEDWKFDLGTVGEVYNVNNDDPLVCHWKKDGEYKNIARIEYKD